MTILLELGESWGFIARTFDVITEATVPSWYASVLWACLGLVAVTSAVLTRQRLGWSAFAAIAFAASLDETVALHELLDNFGVHWQAALGTNLWFTWVLPGTVIAVVVPLLLGPVVWSMPAGQRLLLIGSGGIFLLGAVVVETISGLVIASFNDQVTWHYVLLALIEEFLEFAGVAVAVGAVAGTFEWRLDRHGLRVRYLGSDADRRQAARQRADAGSVLGRTAAADVVQPASCLRD